MLANQYDGYLQNIQLRMGYCLLHPVLCGPLLLHKFGYDTIVQFHVHLQTNQ